MPSYAYVCRRCDTHAEKLLTVSTFDTELTYCPICAEPMEWDPSVSARRNPFKAFITKHATGKPIEIDSMHKLRKVEKQYNVNFPAYGDTMLDGNTGQNERTWTDEGGRNHYE